MPAAARPPGTLPHRISPDDSMWQIDTEGDKKSITIVLQKEARVEWVRYLIL